MENNPFLEELEIFATGEAIAYLRHNNQYFTDEDVNQKTREILQKLAEKVIEMFDVED